MAKKKKKRNMKKAGLYADVKGWIHKKIKKGINSLFATTPGGRDIHSATDRRKKEIERQVND